MTLPKPLTASSTPRALPTMADLGRAVAFFAIYLALDKISYLDAPRPFAVMAWNPSLGVCVAVAAIWGMRALPLVFAAPLLAALLFRGFPLTPLYTIFVALLAVAKVYVIVNGGAYLAARATSPLFRNVQSALLLIAIPATLAISIVHAVALLPIGILPADKCLETIERLWIGDLIGVFVQTPFCLLALRVARERTMPSVAWMVEVAVQSILVISTLWFIFGVHRVDASDYFYLLFLPMIWVVLNHGLGGAIVLNMVVQGVTITYLLWSGPAQSDLIFFQALAIVLVASSLTLGLAVEQSRAATERLRAREQEVAASMKSAATSELAGALAHELSHPIGAVSNYSVALSQLIARMPHADPEIGIIAEKLRREARRATVTVRRLRDFFRSGTLTLEAATAAEIAREAAGLLDTRFSAAEITVRIVTPSQPAVVLVDRIQMLGVVHNLLLNAIDAVESMPSDRRAVEINITRGRELATIAVEDSGPGIAPDIRDQLFEALATTKRDGLGLGLSMSRSIVQAHGGTIHLETSLLGGARFVVTLPLEKT